MTSRTTKGAISGGGGHGDEGVIGCWPLVAWCFCWHGSYIKVGIVLMYIPNVFFSGL
jgi:hypothetical protein